MKRLLVLFLLFVSSAAAQGVRFSATVTQQGTIGTSTNIVVLPATPIVKFCLHPANAVPCTNVATTYTDQTLITPCAGGNQIVRDGTSTCVASPDAQNNWGVWVAPNTLGYDYTITLPGGVNLGPFNVLSQTTTLNNPCTIGGFIYVSTGGCYTTVSAAIASFSGGLCGTVYIPSGSFSGNITINNTTCTPTGQSGITLQGAGRRTTILKPSSNAAVITIDSTTAALQSINIRDIGFDNTGSGFAQPAILFQGANINDHHELHRLFMLGFKNSVNVTGRMVWQTFDDIEIAGDTDIAMNILTAAATDNLIRLKNITVTSAAGAWGIQVSCTGACGGSSIFAKVTLEGGDIEAGTGGGIVFNNIDSPSVLNSYFESNGGPHISVTGTVGRGIFIAGNFLHSNLAQNLMSFTATQLAGIVVGNSLAPAGGGKSYVQTTSGSGNGLFIIGNFDTGTHTISADANGTYHTSVYGSYAPVTLNTSGAQTPNVAGINHLHYQNTVAATITNFLNGDPGQTLDVTEEGSSTVAFTHANTGGPYMINAQSVTLAAGQSCRFIFEPLNSRWFETSCTNGSFATLTGTETLTNKSLTSPALTGTPTVNGVPIAGGFTSVNVTPATASANTAADQNGMAVTVTAGALNSVSRTLLIQLAGVYSTPAASTSVITDKLKLCTVSGCGSGTVITLATWTTTALGGIQATNDPFNCVLNATTQTAGASAAFESHGNLTIDLAALATAAESVFADGNTATVGTIDSTAQLFLQHTKSFSNASASNSFTDRQLIADTVD